MPDDPVRRALDLIDRPLEPDAGFRQRLLERLLRETEARPRRIGARVPLGRPETRRALMIAAVFAVTIAVLAVVLGSLRQLGEGDVPAGPIDRSSSFVVTLEGHIPRSPDTDLPGSFTLRVSWSSPDLWRIDLTGGDRVAQPLINHNVGSPGGYLLWDHGTLTGFEGETGTIVPQGEHASWFSPLNLLGFDDEHAGWTAACANAELFPDETVAGRPTHHMRCADGPFGPADLWIDVDSGLILRLVSRGSRGDPEPPGPIMWLEGERLEATAVEYDPAFPEDTFTLPTDVPTSPLPPTEGASTTDLEIGQAPPDMTGRTLDGEPFDLASRIDRPTLVYLWADWCGPCVGAIPDALDEISATRNDLSVVTIGIGVDTSTLRTYMQEHGYTFPVVLPDRPDEITKAWGVEGIPVLLVLDRSGRVAGIYAGWDGELGQPSEIETIADAAAAGGPLPGDLAGFSGQRTT